MTSFLGRIVLLLALICISQRMYSQQSDLKGRVNVKLGYSKFEEYNNSRKSQLIASADFGVFKYVELGPYFGYTEFRGQTHHNTAFYGISTNFHFIPFLLKKGVPRIDVFFGNRIGFYRLPNVLFSENNTHLDFGILAGINYYPWNHLGLFIEKGYANGFGELAPELSYHRNYFRIGIALKYN